MGRNKNRLRAMKKKKKERKYTHSLFCERCDQYKHHEQLIYCESCEHVLCYSHGHYDLEKKEERANFPIDERSLQVRYGRCHECDESAKIASLQQPSQPEPPQTEPPQTGQEWSWIVHRNDVPDEVYVGYPSIWANPYTTETGYTPMEAFVNYEQNLINTPDLWNRLLELRDKTLACCCKLPLCHTEILVYYANFYDGKSTFYRNESTTPEIWSNQVNLEWSASEWSTQIAPDCYRWWGEEEEEEEEITRGEEEGEIKV